jgi:protein MpaA
MHSLKPRLAGLLGALSTSLRQHAALLRVARGRICAKYVAIALAGSALALACMYGVLFVWPRSVAFSYSRQTCITNPTLLPNIVRSDNTTGFRTSFDKQVRLGEYPIYAQETCIAPLQPPKEQATQLITLSVSHASFIHKVIHINSGKAPTLRLTVATDKPVPTRQPLTFTLSQADKTFDYQLAANNQVAPCTKQLLTVSCDITPLNLAQSVQYTFTLKRLFAQKPVGDILKTSLKTVEAVTVTNTSVAPGQIIYNIPTSLSVTLSKPVAPTSTATLSLLHGNDPQQLATTTTVAGNILTVTWAQPLPRSAQLQLKLADLESADGGYLLTPYILTFSTSGGPKVISTNIGSNRVSPAASVVLSFDTAIMPTQNISQFASIQTSSGVVPATVSVNGSRVTITPASSLGRCTAFTVKITDGIQNEFGVSGGSAWQYSSRTLCQTVFSIGTPVQGRDITAYSFGTGATKIIFVGDTHGNEKSSAYILTDLVNYLESNPSAIPADHTVTIIPKLNPDGFAANTRTNAHNVDLNRNFPANNWKSSVTMPDLTFLAAGGGASPLSEPESQAIANFVVSQNPRLVLTYHAQANIVAPNNSGDSVTLAHIYAQKSPVYFLADDQSSTVFAYDTTGAFEDWLHDKYSIPTLLIELNTETSYEFSGHRPAMLDMITR